MVNIFRTFIFLTLISLPLSSSWGKLSGYLAFSPNYSGIGAARVGWNDIEFGLFSPGSFGFNKVFKLRSPFYATMGMGIVTPGTFGFFGGAGLNKMMFWGTGLRAEFYAVQGIGGSSQGAATLGLSWNF